MPTKPPHVRLRAFLKQHGPLLNAADIARRWNVSRMRVSQLAARPAFPKPICEIGGNPVWLAADVDAFRAGRVCTVHELRQPCGECAMETARAEARTV